MAITPKRLYHDNPPNGDTTIFTATARTVVQVVLASNTTAAPLAVSLRLDPTGAGAAKDLLNTVSVPANDALRLAGPIVLETGDALIARNHTAALGVALLVSGFTVS